MGNISVTLPIDGTTAEVADYNTPITTIVNEINGNLDNSNIAAAAAIATSKLAEDEGIGASRLADSAVTPEKVLAGTGTTWAWQSWTPTWTNLVVSGSTVTARYIQVGKTVIFRVAVILGGGNAPSGSVSFTLPVTSTALAGTTTIPPIGTLDCFDAGTAVYPGVVTMNSTTVAGLAIFAAGGTYTTNASLSATVPFAWGNTDEIVFNGMYEAA